MSLTSANYYIILAHDSIRKYFNSWLFGGHYSTTQWEIPEAEDRNIYYYSPYEWKMSYFSIDKNNQPVNL